MSELQWIGVFGWVVFWSMLGAVVGKGKGQAASGVVWCALLGPIGVLITLLLPENRDGGWDDPGAKWERIEDDVPAPRATRPAKREAKREAPNSTGSFCPQCGTKRAQAARFCASCGAQLGEDVADEVSTGSARLDALAKNLPPPGKS